MLKIFAEFAVVVIFVIALAILVYISNKEENKDE